MCITALHALHRLRHSPESLLQSIAPREMDATAALAVQHDTRSLQWLSARVIAQRVSLSEICPAQPHSLNQIVTAKCMHAVESLHRHTAPHKMYAVVWSTH